MKNHSLLLRVCAYAWAFLSLTACGDDDTEGPGGTKIEVTTAAVTEISGTKAVSGGTVSGDEGAVVTRRGVCWSQSENPTVSDASTSDGEGLGSFRSELTGLQEGAVYHVRAYAVSGNETIYGNAVSFKAESLVPTVTTSVIDDISYRSATGGGTVESPGASEVTAVGICWSTEENPTIENDNTEGDPSETEFSLPLENLRSGTLYYVRAFAANESGVAYGQQVSFTTLAEELVVLPDPAFMQYALDNFDENWDGQLQTGETAAVTSIDCSGLGIVSLEGIGQFAKLQTLVANDNPISAIDLSQNTDLTRVELIRTSFEELAVEGLPRLETLLCDGLKENLPGPLRRLSVKECPKLQSVYCQENSLETLEISGCPELSLLWCYTNALTSLNLTECPGLTELKAWDNDLASLDLSANKALSQLEIQRNPLTELSVADCPELIHIWCDGLTKTGEEEILGSLRSVSLTNCPKLEELNFQENSVETLSVSGCPALKKVYGWRNRLASLDLSGCTSLTECKVAANRLARASFRRCAALDLLDIPDNALAELDLSGCGALREIWLQNNRTLTSLDLSDNTNLQIFRGPGCGIRSLDLSGHPRLTSVWCDNNGMESLRVDGCTALTELKCQANSLTTLDVEGCTSLGILWCDTNNLSEIDLRGCAALTECNVQANRTLDALDLTGCTKLATLNAYDCALTSLDLSSCDNLELVQVNDNRLTTLAVHGKKLHDVHCVRNQLASFSATDTPALIVLWLHDNLLTTLDVSECADRMEILGVYTPDDPVNHTNPLQTLYMRQNQEFANRYVPESAEIRFK